MIPGKGKADHLELGDYNAVCWECGRKFKASELKKHWKGYFVCARHWEARHPQDFVRSIREPQVPTWVQQMPADTFIEIGYPGATAGCAIAGYAQAGNTLPCQGLE